MTKMLKILLFILIVSIVFYAGIKFREVKQGITIQKEQNVNKVDTSGWKTYRNEEYGYTLKYPNDLTIKDQLKYYVAFYKSDQKKAFFIDVAENKSASDYIAGQVKDFDLGLPPLATTISVIGGKDIPNIGDDIRRWTLMKTYLGDGKKDSISLLITHKNNRYMISLQDANYEKLITPILDNFIFFK